jgi:hypothetical protein
MLKRTMFLVTMVLCAACGETPEEKAARAAEVARGQEDLAKWYAENPKTEVVVPPRSSQQNSGGLTKEHIRVVRENRRGDDSSREYIFMRQIKALGQRCDSVESAIMGAPGDWTISCAPGYDYRLSYGEDGEPTRAQRAQ